MTIDVSVIVPAHNAERHVAEAVRSLLDQSLRQLEVIVVDDASTDSTAEVVTRLSHSDQRVTLVSGPGTGPSAARNAGLDAARGTYVSFLDADDVSVGDSLETLVSAAQLHDADVVVAGCLVEDLNAAESVVAARQLHLTPGRIDPDQPPAMTGELTTLVGYAWNKLYRAELLRGHRFPEGQRLFEDLAFNAAVFEEAQRVVLVDEPVVRYRQRPVSTAGTTIDSRFLALRSGAIADQRRIYERWGVDRVALERQVLTSHRIALISALRRVIGACDPDSRSAEFNRMRRLYEQSPSLPALPARLTGDLVSWWLLRKLPARVLVKAYSLAEDVRRLAKRGA